MCGLAMALMPLLIRQGGQGIDQLCCGSMDAPKGSEGSYLIKLSQVSCWGYYFCIGGECIQVHEIGFVSEILPECGASARGR